MTLALVTPETLGSILRNAMSKPDKRRVVALQAQASWDGPSELRVADRDVTVVVASSPIEFRQVMIRRSPTSEDSITVVLTPLDDSSLGFDVTARLVRYKVLNAEALGSASAVLGLVGIDADLTRERWLLDDLARLATHEGVVLGFHGRGLDIETAWGAWLQHRLSVAQEPTSAEETLAVLTRPETGTALSTIAPPARAALAHRWDRLGLPTEVLIDLVVAGRGGDLVPFGLVLDAVCATTNDAAQLALQQTARIRLESDFGRARVTVPQERVWADAAKRVLAADKPPFGEFAMDRRTVTGRGPNVQTWLDQAEHLLAGLDTAHLASLSAVLRGGFNHRVQSSALALQRLWGASVVGAGDLREQAEQLAVLRNHPEAAEEGQNKHLLLLEAAMRLLQRRAIRSSAPRATPAPTSEFPRTIEAWSRTYADDLAWVDRCRGALIEGGNVSALTELATAVLADVDREREASNTDFATSYVNWDPSHDARAGVVAIENVVPDVLVPIARTTAVLVIVLDGAGIAAMSNLLAGLRSNGWTLHGPGEPAALAVSVAVLPSVTEFCRASLFAGALCQGVAANEKKLFSAHTELRATGPKRPPVLFHKADLAGPDGQALATPVREAILDAAQRVVGVVVNAFDDHLSSGSQIVTGWDLGVIRHLPDLLDLARDAGRAVIITADHGHVLDGGRGIAQSASGVDHGDRWRLPFAAITDHEREVSGPRVLGGGGRVVVPIDERTRYGGKKHGYHGGLTPQEVLVPLAVFARSGVDVPGWSPVAGFEPDWWELGALPLIVIAEEPAATAPAAVAAVPHRRARAKPAPDVTPLFEPEPVAPPVAAVSTGTGASSKGGWIAALLASPLFIAQRAGAARQPITDERLTSLLRAISKHGFTLPRDALTLAVGGQPARLRGEVSTLRRILNVAGYETFSDTDNTLTLNVDLLALQFEIDIATIRGTA